MTDSAKFEYPPVWPHNEIGISFSIDPKEDAEIKAALDRSYEEMMRNLGISMYADDGKPRPKLSLAVRFLKLKNRIHDAWDVLTGRAEIY